MGEYHFGLRHAPGTAPLAGGKHSLVRRYDAVAQLAQVRHIPLGLAVSPHSIVHGRNEQHGSLRRQQHSGQQISRLATRGPRQKIRGRGRDDDHVRLPCQLDVVERASGVEQPGVHRPSRESLERDGADELGRGRRKHDIDLGASHADL